MSNLFQIQDDDRPMWVIAEDYGHAVKRWREQIAQENPDDDCSAEQPNGVNLVASGTDEMPEILLYPNSVSEKSVSSPVRHYETR